MRIFKIIKDSNNIQAVQPVKKVENLLDFLNFDCDSREDNWKEIEVYIYNPKTKPKNFYNMGSGTLIFDEKTLDACETVFEMAGEILSIQVERGPKLYILNVLQCMNGLDYDKTVWDYYPRTGRKGRILQYAFHPERVLNEASIFKIPEESKTSIFCYADVKNPDDEFYHLYHKHKLTGLIFEELYNNGKPHEIY
jgi:hypothetical protein